MYLWENFFPAMLKYEKSFNRYRHVRESKIRRVGVEVYYRDIWVQDC